MRALGAAILVIAALANGKAEAAPPLVPPALTATEESELGDAIAARIAAQGVLIETESDVRSPSDRLGALLLRLATGDNAPAAPWPWRIHVLRSGAVTSFDTPGGHIYLSRGLILACRDESELRAAIAHQMAHAMARDTLATMASGYGQDRVIALARGETPSILDGIAANLASSGTLARHSMAVELAADAETGRLGASPAALHGLVSRIASKREPPAPWAPDTSWRKLTARHVDVHPVTRERLAAMSALAAPGTDASESDGAAQAFARLRERLLAP